MNHGTRNQRVQALYQRERDRLFRVALRVSGGRRGFAEDVVQDVFVQLLSRYDGLDDSRDLGGWLYRCTMNGCFTRLRKEAVRKNPLVMVFWGDQQQEPPSADVQARLDGTQRDALAALATLSPRERIAFCMVRLDETPLAAVAEVLGCSVSTACKLVQRAERTLEREGWRTGARAPAPVPTPPLPTAALSTAAAPIGKSHA